MSGTQALAMPLGGRLCVRCRRRLDLTSVVCPHDGHRTLEISQSLDPRINRVVDDKLTLLGLVGTGGSGAVYRALEHTTEREVAVKLLHPLQLQPVASGTTAEEEPVQRFFQEARNASRLSHPNVITLFDFGQTPEGELYLVMELLRGRDLTTILEETVDGKLEPRRAVEIALQVCEALSAAHDLGVIHRDIKSDNIFIIPGIGGKGEHVKVIDFGIAKNIIPDHIPEEITPRGIVLGTPYSMSPEQALGRKVTPRSDLYSLGVLLYEMLAGHRPFERGTPMDTLVAHIRDLPPTLPLLGLDLPEKLLQLIQRTLTKEPDDRPASAAELKGLLLESLEDRDGVALSEPEPAPTSAPRAQEESRVTNIVPALSSFIGRAEELDALDDIFCAGHRLVTLHGPGGMGKSRLALEYGRSRIQEIGTASDGRRVGFEGTWRCALAEAETEEMLYQELAVVLGLWLEAIGSDPAIAIGEALSTKGKILLILDDVEQTVELIGPLLLRWLSTAPRLRIIVTSRQTLLVPNELVHEVGPLAIPRQGDVTDDVDRASAAVRLFVKRAQQVRPTFQLDESNAAAVAEIVRSLDGMPLALELAAARTTMFAPAQLLERLEHRFRLLAGPRRSVTQRQGTLEQTLDWSWSLLAAYEQRVLAQLSVFRGGFSIEALEAVVDLSAQSAQSTEDTDASRPQYEGRPWVVDLVQSLCDKSLVRVSESAALDGELRFSLYESIRLFAQSRLEESGETKETEARHAAFFLWNAGEWSDAAREQGDAVKRRLLTQELDNVVALFHRAMATRPLKQESVELGLLALVVAAPALAWRGPVGVYLGWLDEALDAAKSTGVRQPLYTKAVHVRATMLTRFGRFKESVSVLEQVIELARENKDERIEADALRMLGMSLAARGRHEQANDALEQARQLMDRERSPVLSIEIDKAAGLISYMLRQFDRAVVLWVDALALARVQGLASEVVVLLHNIGDARSRLEDYDGALDALGESLDLAREHHLDRMVELNEFLYGCVEVVKTKSPEPLAMVTAALETARNVGNRWVIVQAGYFLGRAFVELEEPEKARAFLTESLELAREDDHHTYIEDCEELLDQLD